MRLAREALSVFVLVAGCGGKVDYTDFEGGVPPDGFKCGVNICKKGLEYCLDHIGPARGAPRWDQSFECKSLPSPDGCNHDTCTCAENHGEVTCF